LHAQIEETERRAEQDDDRCHPGGETGIAKEPHVEKGMPPPHFDDAEHRRDDRRGDEPAPDQGIAPAAVGRFQDRGHRDRDGRADQDRAQRIDPGRVVLPRRHDGARQRGDAQRPNR
jgi:hypothetical protein